MSRPVASVDSLLDGAFTTLLGKAHQEFEQTRQAQEVRPATINVNFSGGGSALSIGKPCIARVPFPCSIQSVELYAGNELGIPVAVTTTVDLWLVNLEGFTLLGQTPLHGIGARAGLVAQAAAAADLTGWIVNFEATDRLIGRIESWTGTATWLAVLIHVLPTLVPQGTAQVVDSQGGDTVIDDAGNTVVYRS